MCDITKFLETMCNRYLDVKQFIYECTNAEFYLMIVPFHVTKYVSY